MLERFQEASIYSDSPRLHLVPSTLVEMFAETTSGAPSEPSIDGAPTLRRWLRLATTE